MDTILTLDFEIDSREADMHGLCRASGLLNFMQQGATVHAEQLGFAREVLMERYGAFWITARIHIRLWQPLQYEDILTLSTWPRPARGAAVYRDYDFYVGDKQIGEAVTMWAIMQKDTRSLMRPNQVEEVMGAVITNHDRIKTERVSKLQMPEGLQPIGTRQIHYSDTDINGHMNNVKYADVVCDALHYERMPDKFLSELRIGYVSECFAGEEILLLGTEQEGTYFIRGTDENDKIRFDAAAKFADRHN